MIDKSMAQKILAWKSYYIKDASSFWIYRKKVNMGKDELRLVGHSPDITDPKSYHDLEYKNLYDNAQVILKWQ